MLERHAEGRQAAAVPIPPARRLLGSGIEARQRGRVGCGSMSITSVAIDQQRTIDHAAAHGFGAACAWLAPLSAAVAVLMAMSGGEPIDVPTVRLEDSL